MNKTEAIKATRNGAIAACISASMTLIMILIAIRADAEGKFALFNDPVNFFDVALILACAYGLYKKSRAASVLIFIYFLASKIIISIETQAYGGLGFGLIFLYFYGKAIRGSFVYHQLEKKENPDYKATSKWTYLIGVPSVLIVVVLIGFSLMSTTGVVPSTRVLAKNEINIEDITTLRSNGIITVNDSVDYFYSQGFSSILESGNILTQDRVLLYYTDEKEGLLVYEVSINDITNVEMESQGDIINDSVYKVNTIDPERWIRLFLSVQQKGDQKFVKALQSRLIR